MLGYLDSCPGEIECEDKSKRLFSFPLNLNFEKFSAFENKQYAIYPRM
jgi:hypothetical protein